MPDSYEEIIVTHAPHFSDLSLYHKGQSREIRRVPGVPHVLLQKLVPSVFSLEAKKAVPLAGIDEVRNALHQVFDTRLKEKGIKTSWVYASNGLSVITEEKMSPLEVVVKSRHVGSPKHQYLNMEEFPTREGARIASGSLIKPYVRFDWRNPLPTEDACMPDGLANEFIDCVTAKKTALNAFFILQEVLKEVEFELVDICFFMNEAGDVICGEVSTDNTRINYIGSDPILKSLFSERDLQARLWQAKILLHQLQHRAAPPLRLILSGPFCTGKTTLIQKITEAFGIPKLIDESTRPMRKGEFPEFPYKFISVENFLDRKEAGAYHEWVFFGGNYYGVPREKLGVHRWSMDLLSASWAQYQGHVEGVIGIFISPPSEAELIRRATLRGDSLDGIAKRVASAKTESSDGYPHILGGEKSVEEKFEAIKRIMYAYMASN